MLIDISSINKALLLLLLLLLLSLSLLLLLLLYQQNLAIGLNVVTQLNKVDNC